MPKEEIDTLNKFVVARRGSEIIIINLPALTRPLSEADALLLAAYLVALGGSREAFDKVYTAVCNA